MLTAFWILGWLMWNGCAFFILRALNRTYDKNCNITISCWQLLKALMCLIAMLAVGMTAILAVVSLMISNDEDE